MKLAYSFLRSSTLHVHASWGLRPDFSLCSITCVRWCILFGVFAITFSAIVCPQVQKAINALMKSRTTLVIAHRLSTVSHYMHEAGQTFVLYAVFSKRKLVASLSALPRCHACFFCSSFRCGAPTKLWSLRTIRCLPWAPTSLCSNPAPFMRTS